MFKVKKVYTPGQCWAMRCTEADNGEAEKLCPRHTEEWVEAECPDLAPTVREAKATEETKDLKEPDTSEEQSALADLEGFEIKDEEEYQSLVEVLHDTINKREAVDSERTNAGRKYYEPWKHVNDTYKKGLDVYDRLISHIKGCIVDLRLRTEAAQDEAIKNKSKVPDFLQDPPGVSFKQEVSVWVANLNLVPEEYLKMTVDTEAVLAAVADGVKEIPGLSISSSYKVIYRRPSKDE